MAGYNKVILMGNLGSDPEKKVTPEGKARTKFSLATTEKWTDKNGQKQEKTEWHNIITWGNQAEVCAQYLSKGKSVFVEGKIRTRSWEDKESGQKKYITEIQADRVQFLGSPSASKSGTSNTEPFPSSNDTNPGFDPNSDDVPF